MSADWQLMNHINLYIISARFMNLNNLEIVIHFWQNNLGQAKYLKIKKISKKKKKANKNQITRSITSSLKQVP